MNEPKDLVVIKGQLTKIENRANEVVVASQEDYEKGADLLSQLKTIASTIKKEKEAIMKPLNEALRGARDLFAPIEEQFTNAEAILKAKLLAYKRKVDDEARAKELKIAADLESGKIKSIETAEKKMDKIERVEQTTRGKIGEVQVRKVKKVRITDEMAVPRSYLELNMVAIRKDALSGVVIPGVEVYEEETIASSKF